MSSIEANLQQVRQRITRACHDAGRPAQSVTLLAVTKTFGATQVRQAHAAGQRDFGENYVQEALAKIDALADLRAQLRLAPDRPAAEQQDPRRWPSTSTGCTASTG